MVLAMAILVGWFVLSFPIAVLVGRALRAASKETAAPMAPDRSGLGALPPRQRGSGAGPQAA